MLLYSAPNVTRFTIRGLTDIPQLRFPIFFIFLLTYIMIISGNKAIFVVICGDSRLHTPMYIFLMNLSLIDIGNASNILPKLLNIFLTQDRTISLVGCITQMYVFLSLTCAEIILLAAMAYDRYVAICQPLHYYSLMSLRYCTLLIMTAWSMGLLSPVGHCVYVSGLPFCTSHDIDHIFCDLTPLLKLSCRETSLVEILTYTDGALFLMPAFTLTLISYVCIISTIINMKSVEGQRKAFSTCASHLTCVILFYGTIMCLYMKPTSSYSSRRDKFFSLVYIVLVPILNPVIYSLKNKDVKDALKKLCNNMRCQ
ncbi:olfactory receptor 5AR1-like [Pelodytes ibericus]